MKGRQIGVPGRGCRPCPPARPVASRISGSFRPQCMSHLMPACFASRVGFVSRLACAPIGFVPKARSLKFHDKLAPFRRFFPAGSTARLAGPALRGPLEVDPRARPFFAGARAPCRRRAARERWSRQKRSSWRSSSDAGGRRLTGKLGSLPHPRNISQSQQPRVVSKFEFWRWSSFDTGVRACRRVGRKGRTLSKAPRGHQSTISDALACSVLFPANAPDRPADLAIRSAIPAPVPS
jgi:hypothetical protein